MHFKILFKSRDLMLVQAKWYLMLCVQNITHKNEALHGYVLATIWQLYMTDKLIFKHLEMIMRGFFQVDDKRII